MSINLGKTSNVDAKIQLYKEYSERLISKDIVNAEVFVREGLKLANKEGKYEYIGYFHQQLGLIEYRNENPVNSLHHYELSLKGYEKIENKLKQSEILSNIGVVYRYTENYDLALDYFLRSYSISESHNDQFKQAITLNNIGLIYIQVKEYKSAIESFEESLKLKSEQDYDLGIAVTIGNLGEVYLLMKDTASALSYFNQSLAISYEINDRVGICNNYINIGKIFLKTNKIDSALHLFNGARDIALELNLKSEVIRATYNVALVQIENNQFEKAIQNLKKAEELCLAIDKKSSLLDVYEQLISLYAKKGLFTKAYTYSQLLLDKREELQETEIVKNTYKQKLSFEFQQNKNELKRILEKEKYLNKIKEQDGLIRFVTTVGIMTLVLIVLSVIGVKLKRSLSSSTKEKQKLRLEIESKNKKLIQKAMRINQSENLINESKTKIIEIAYKLPTELSNQLVGIGNELKNHYDKNFWDEFEVHFSEIHTNFYENLIKKHPNLTINEKKLCAYLKMNLSSKEIASITLKSIGSIEKARSRLRKKLNISSSGKLSSYLDSF